MSYNFVAKGVHCCGKRGTLLWQKGYIAVAKGVHYPSANPHVHWDS